MTGFIALAAMLLALMQQPEKTLPRPLPVGRGVGTFSVEYSQGETIYSPPYKEEPGEGLSGEGLLAAVVTTSGSADSLVARIKADGYRAMVIGPTTITVRATADYMEQLAAMEDVCYVQQAAQMMPMMQQARTLTGADRVHRGEGLETPFTGKGVIIGIIDQGFEFRHIAFLDSEGRTRVKALWNRSGYAEGTDGEPTTEIPSTGDGIASTSHATHVAGIAAGSRIEENEWYGMAPEAEIVMVPSEFNSAEVLEDVRWIADLARSEGKPWVVNMSFGTCIGSHDGTDPAFVPLDDIITEQPGGMIVAATGNDGDKTMHASHTFQAEGDTVRLYIQPGSYATHVDLWCQQADSAAHLALRPFVGHDGIREYLADDVVEQILAREIAPFNRKEHYTLTAASQAVRGYGSQALLGVEMTAAEGVAVHAWTTLGLGTFVAAADNRALTPDSRYQVYQPASALVHGVAVGAYNSTTSYVNLQGQLQTAEYGEEGALCTFSNQGPSLHQMPQPTVCAPGAMVISALSKYEQGFSKNASHITGDVKRGLKHFYYGAYAGTSMATPMVTGAIALWLQANPLLTHEQIHKILQTTSHQPAAADELGRADGDEVAWDPQWGYGQIDVYEGLKMALLMRGAVESVRDVSGSGQPFTLSWGPGRYWRILFNSDEPWADIAITDIAGNTIVKEHLAGIQQGQETFLRLPPSCHGIYLIKLCTAHARFARKIMVPSF